MLFYNALSRLFQYLIFIYLFMVYFADPGGRAVEDVGLRPLNCWDCGFESRLGHGCLSVVCCQVEAAMSRSLVRGNPTECVSTCVCVCDQVKQ